MSNKVPTGTAAIRSLSMEIERGSRLRYPVGILALSPDLVTCDDSKLGADTAGKVCAAIKAMLRADLRAIDTAARIDENVLLFVLPGAGVAALETVGYRIRVQSERAEHIIDERAFRTTVSLGGAVFPLHAYDDHVLLHLARMALGRARAHGGNRTIVHEQRVR